MQWRERKEFRAYVMEWLFQIPDSEIAANWNKRAGASQVIADDIRRIREGLEHCKGHADPTPEEIAQRAAEERAKWTPLQWKQHATAAIPKAFEIPRMSMSAIRNHQDDDLGGEI